MSEWVSTPRFQFESIDSRGIRTRISLIHKGLGFETQILTISYQNRTLVAEGTLLWNQRHGKKSLKYGNQVVTICMHWKQIKTWAKSFFHFILLFQLLRTRHFPYYLQLAGKEIRHLGHLDTWEPNRHSIITIIRQVVKMDSFIYIELEDWSKDTHFLKYLVALLRQLCKWFLLIRLHTLSKTGISWISFIHESLITNRRLGQKSDHHHYDC